MTGGQMYKIQRLAREAGEAAESYPLHMDNLVQWFASELKAEVIIEKLESIIEQNEKSKN